MKKIILLLISTLLSVTISCKKIDKNNFTDDVKIPQRIVSLTPAGTEILCAIGAFDQLVARTDFCDYPAEVSSLPSVGGFDGKTLSIETILSYKPDFVYATQGMHDALLPLLKQQKVPYYLSYANSIDAILKEISDIGKITGHQKEAENLTDNMKNEIQLLKNKYKDYEKVSLYWEIWYPPYMSIGKLPFINELVTVAGGKNIFDNIEEEYPVVSEEAIISAKPEIIIIPTYDENGIQAVKARKEWQNVPALKNNRIYALDADLISRPGPRIIEATQLIAEKLHE